MDPIHRQTAATRIPHVKSRYETQNLRTNNVLILKCCELLAVTLVLVPIPLYNQLVLRTAENVASASHPMNQFPLYNRANNKNQ